MDSAYDQGTKVVQNQSSQQVTTRRTSTEQRLSRNSVSARTESVSLPPTKVLDRQWLEPTNQTIIDKIAHHEYKASALEEFSGPLFKVILVGDSGIGKSCVLKRQVANEFTNNLDVTVGVEFGNFIINIDDTPLKLEIWDTAGQDAYRSITKIFYRGANAIILGYSITNTNSFKNLVHWMEEINQSVENDVPIFLVGNKADLVKNRKVSHESALAFQDQNDVDYFIETSALSGQHVDTLFLDISKMLYSQFQRQILAYKIKRTKAGVALRNEPISFIGQRQNGSFALAESEFRATQLQTPRMGQDEQNQKQGKANQRKSRRQCKC